MSVSIEEAISLPSRRQSAKIARFVETYWRPFEYE